MKALLKGLGSDMSVIQATVGKTGFELPTANEVAKAEAIILLYQQILGRNPMPQAGKPDVWYDQYNKGLNSLENIAKIFYTSDEYKSKHGGAPATPAQVAQTVTEVKQQAPVQPSADMTTYYIIGGVAGVALLVYFLKKRGR